MKKLLLCILLLFIVSFAIAQRVLPCDTTCDVNFDPIPTPTPVPIPTPTPVPVCPDPNGPNNLFCIH